MADNLRKLSLAEISVMIEKEGLNWIAGETSISSFPLSVQEKHLGLTITKSELNSIEKAVKRQAENETAAFKVGPFYGTPVEKDWRNVDSKNYVSPVKNQGTCASGPCFDTCSTIEANMRIKAQDHMLNTDLSVAFLLFCGGGDCTNGLGWLTAGLDFAKNTGITDEACFPYQPRDMPCSDRCGDWDSRLTKILSYTSHSSMQARKNAIANVGPALGAMAIYSDFFSYQSGIYQKTSSSTLVGYTSACVVGYNDNQQCWIIMKSWGTGWGEEGFCRIGYGQPELKIDTTFPFYSVEPDIEPSKGKGIAEYILVDKNFGGSVILWAYVGGKWRYKYITDADLAGIAQELFAANRVDVWWEKNQISMIRARKG